MAPQDAEFNPPTFPGDSLIPDAAMVYDNKSRLINAPASAVWPWIVQIGRGRGGWYLTSTTERFLPRRMCAARDINPKWQELAVGDRIPDYGFSSEDYFDVAMVEEQKWLVFKSERYGAFFTWALLLEPARHHDVEIGVVVHLRFRGRIERTGWQRRALVLTGRWMDWLTTALMLAGLADRAESAWRERQRS